MQKQERKCFLASIFSISTLLGNMARKPLEAKVIKLERKKRSCSPSKEQLIPEMAKFSQSRLKNIGIISFIFKDGEKLFLNLLGCSMSSALLAVCRIRGERDEHHQNRAIDCWERDKCNLIRTHKHARTHTHTVTLLCVQHHTHMLLTALHGYTHTHTQ